MPRAKVTVYLDEDIGNALSAQAASEGRSVSQMAGRLLTGVLIGMGARPAESRPTTTEKAAERFKRELRESGAGAVQQFAEAMSDDPVLVTDPEFSQ